VGQRPVPRGFCHGSTVDARNPTRRSGSLHRPLNCLRFCCEIVRISVSMALFFGVRKYYGNCVSLRYLLDPTFPGNLVSGFRLLLPQEFSAVFQPLFGLLPNLTSIDYPRHMSYAICSHYQSTLYNILSRVFSTKLDTHMLIHVTEKSYTKIYQSYCCSRFCFG